MRQYESMISVLKYAFSKSGPKVMVPWLARPSEAEPTAPLVPWIRMPVPISSVLPASLDLGTGRTSSVGDVVEAIRELTGATVAAHYGAVPARKNDADVADADATAAVLGWRAGIGLRDGLRATIDWHARRGAPTRPHARDA